MGEKLPSGDQQVVREQFGPSVRVETDPTRELGHVLIPSKEARRLLRGALRQVLDASRAGNFGAPLGVPPSADSGAGGTIIQFPQHTANRSATQ